VSRRASLAYQPRGATSCAATSSLERFVLSSSDEIVPVVVDGKCGPVEHSWLCFSDGVIIDPYVPGRLPAVQIVDPIVGVAYRPGPRRDDIQQSIVDRLVLEMRDAAS
jgi:hypothetical protein